MCSRCWASGAGRLRIPAVLGDEALMLVLMAISAQQLPVAAVGRIVVVVVIAMMHLQQLQVRMRELTRTTAADPRIDLERSISIALGALLACAARVGDHPVEASVVGSSFGSGHD